VISVVQAQPVEKAPADPRLQKAAHDFESMLLTEMLQFGGEEESSSGELGGSQGYNDLRNQAVATALAQSGGIGIARMLLRRLSRGNH